MRAARTATLLLALLPALSWAQQTAPAPSQETGGQAANSEEAVTSKVPLEDIRRFVAVYNAVRAAYVDPVDDKKLMQSAVRGLLLDLDPHSTYFNKEDAQAFDEQANGAYEGIGVEQQQPDNASMKVIAPIDDTPAAKAGILAGDLIIAIDGKPISAIDASEPLRGPAGSKVVLTIVREGRPAVRCQPHPPDHPCDQRAQPPARAGLWLYPPEHVPGRYRFGLPEARAAAAEAVGWPAQRPGAGSAQQPGWPADGRRAGGRRSARQGQHRQHPWPDQHQRRPFRRDPGRPAEGRAGRGAGRCRLGQCIGSAGRCAARQQARARGRQPHLRQGLGADGAAAGQWRFGEADHRALLHAQRQIDPGHRHRAGRRAETRRHAGRGCTAGQPERLQRSHPAGPSARR